MSRPSGHRKSQSTSALAILASSSSSPSTPISRLGQSVSRKDGMNIKSHSRKKSVIAIPSNLDTLTEMSDSLRREESSSMRDSAIPIISPDGLNNGLMDVSKWIREIRSLRSSDRRRLAALRNLERTLVESCSKSSTIILRDLISLEAHTALLSLLTRHAQTLSHRAAVSRTTLQPNDSVASVLVPELIITVTILQGLCLLDRKAKVECGESWVLELFIDLLLVLRAQNAVEGSKPIVYCILDLLCCILVDSPKNARAFEELNGLEGVVRVLRGSGVAKEIRMKCVEFLYFYLLPERSNQQRSTSSSSSSSTSSTESQMYPPAPVDADFDDLSFPHQNSKINSSTYHDLDMTFIPQTPHKKPQPSLGFLTPSNRRISGSSSTTPSLAAITASPRSVPPSPSSRRLASMIEDEEHLMLSPVPSQKQRNQEESMDIPPTPSGRRKSTANHDQELDQNAGLGLGLPRSSTTSNLVRSKSKRDVTTVPIQPGSQASSTTPNFTDPFRASSATSSQSVSTARSNASSGSSSHSTVIAPSRGISRSSTLPSLIDHECATGQPEITTRRVSVRRASKPPSGFSDAITESPESVPKARGSHMRHSRTQSSLAAQLEETPIPGPKGNSSPSVHSGPSSASRTSSRSISSKTRHSRTQSHMSGLPPPPKESLSMPPPPVPAIRRSSLTPPLPIATSRHSSSTASGSSDKSPSSTIMIKTPSTPSGPRRAFPADLTRGIPPALSSPAPSRIRNSPLGPARRVLSGRKDTVEQVGKIKENDKGREDVKSVEEKKRLLGMWLGNVDQLVQGVEKVSFWGSVGK